MIKYSPLRIIAHKLHINGRYSTDYRNRYTSRTSNVCPCLINFSDPANKARHDIRVTLVTTIPGLNKKMQAARLEQEKTLVYELYGLTDEEIAIVEGRGK